MRRVIIVFAKAPVPGNVKTRLIPPLTPQSAAALHAAFVEDTIESLEPLTTTADIELHTDTATPAWPALTLPRRIQDEGDLGLKMFKALGNALHRGFGRALILGSDSPGLPASHVALLLGSDADVALGPTEDGGFYAIAARKIHPAMFNGVRWSTAHALDDTLRACAACGLSTITGERWFDIDGIADLERLRLSNIPRHTRTALCLFEAARVKPA